MRGLASDISINYATVNKADLSLVSDGYLESTRGRGAFVRDLDMEAEEEYSREVDALLSECINTCRDLGLSLDNAQKCMILKVKRIKIAEGIAESGDNVSVCSVSVHIGGTSHVAGNAT